MRKVKMVKRESHHSRILSELHQEEKKILTPEHRYALDIIADKMYKQKHFIRELIQNGDDAGSDKIIFEVDTKSRTITVKNWGKPFDAKDVKQICTMLPSEKKANQIGSLGVGFKSVFAVSDNPRIFSGGFNFEITEYILPTEIEATDPVENQTVPTTFIITLREDILLEPIIGGFQFLNSEMLLFLDNIKEISVKFTGDRNSGYTVVKRVVTRRKFRRMQIEYATITHKREMNDAKESHWITFSRKRKTSEDLKDEIRNALKREMETIYKNPEKYFQPAKINRKIEGKVLKFINPSIAVSSTKDWNLNTMREAKLFIGLPTETMTGLRFHINAEFKPSADRSAIEKTPINDWIICKTTDLICEMMEFMKSTKKYQSQFYVILPDLKDLARIDDRGIIYDKIHSGITDYSAIHNIVLTSANKWAKKDEVCFAEHKEIGNLLSRKDLMRNFGKKHFVSYRLGRGSRAFLKSIGITTITLKDFVDFLSDKDNVTDKSTSWFFDLYVYLGKHLKEDDNDIIETLKKTEMVLIGNKRLKSTSDSDRTICFPPETNLPATSNLFKEDLFFVNKKAFCSSKKPGKKLKNQQSYAKKLLSTLGVEEYSPVNLIDKVILEKFKLEDDAFDLLDKKGKVYQYLAYIKNHFSDYKKAHKDDWKGMRDEIWIKEKDATYYLPEDLYLSAEYTGNKDLEELFEGIEGIYFVSKEYLTCEVKKSGKERKVTWYDFFRELGVEDKPRITVSLADEEYDYDDHSGQVKDLGRYKRSASGWNEYVQYDKKAIDIKKIISWATSRPFYEGKHKIEKLLTVLSRNLNQYDKEIKREIADNWETEQYRTIDSAKWRYHRHYWHNTAVPSNLKCFLISTSWIPTTQNRFREPSQVYVNDKKLGELVGEKADFLTANIDNKALVRFLKINDKPKAKDMIRNLLDLTRKEYYDEDKAEFIFRHINKVEDIADLIEKIGEHESVRKSVIQLANMAYEKFNIKILDRERNGQVIYQEDWWDRFKKNVRILTKNSGFCSPSTVFLPPVPHLDTVLKRSRIENIPFLRDDWRRYETFATNLTVNELEYGSNVKCELVEPNQAKIVDVRVGFVEFEQKIEKIIPFANGAETKKVTNEGDRIEYSQILRSVRVFCVPKLKLRYFITHNEQRYEGIPIPSSVYLRRSGRVTELYIRTNVKNDKGSFELIANELSMLTNPKGDRDYMAKTIKECLLGYPPLDIEKIVTISSETQQPEIPPRETPSPEGPLTETQPPEGLLPKTPLSEAPSPEGPPTETQPPETTSPETPEREKVLVITERQIRDSRPANWVKASYDYHCQICLSREKPELLTYDKSYAGREANRKSIMKAHHINQVAKDKGHDHPGNYLSLCHHHHVLLHDLDLSLGNLKKLRAGIGQKEIVWPNGESVKWCVLTLSNEFMEGDRTIQIVINQQHLDKLEEYIDLILGNDSKEEVSSLD